MTKKNFEIGDIIRGLPWGKTSGRSNQYLYTGSDSICEVLSTPNRLGTITVRCIFPAPTKATCGPEQTFIVNQDFFTLFHRDPEPEAVDIDAVLGW